MKKIQEEIVNIIQNKGIKVVSFDIFDTLIFRSANVPSDVFRFMYEDRPELFPSFTDVDDWINARTTTERLMREKNEKRCGYTEVTISEIYANLPTVYRNRKELYELEIETEKKACFLNPDIYDVLKYCKESLNLKIILVSDMYLGKEIIEDILRCNGFDMKLVDDVYISCDHKKSKRNEDLYNTVLGDISIAPGELLHIGDNDVSDISSARKLGINVFFYPVISEKNYLFPFFNTENMSSPEFTSLRIMSSSFFKELKGSEEDRFWFDQGAMIYGPFLTSAVEFILKKIEEENIRIIRPFMREGLFLSELLEKGAKERGLCIDIKPLFISRQSMFSSTLDNITEENINYILGTYNLTVREVYSLLGIEDCIGRFEKYRDTFIEKTREIVEEEETVFKQISDVLCSDEMIQRIRRSNTGSSDNLLQYLIEMKLNERCMTLDIGWRGSMQSSLHKFLSSHGVKPELENYLLICSPDTVKNEFDENIIKGYVGNFGKDRSSYWSCFVRLMELIFMGECDTTICYQKTENVGVQPVTAKIEYKISQNEAMQNVRAGIKAFQDMYYAFLDRCPFLNRSVNEGKRSLDIINRLHSFPFQNEAEMLGKLEYDQGFGSLSLLPIISEELKEKRKVMDEVEFYGKTKGKEVFWYSGLNMCSGNPFYYYEKKLLMGKRYYEYQILQTVNRALAKRGSRKIVFVQAGKRTRIGLRHLAMAGQLSTVEAILDNDEGLNGIKIVNIRVDKVCSDHRGALYVFLTDRREFFESLISQIRNYYGSEPAFVGWFRDSE